MSPNSEDNQQASPASSQNKAAGVLRRIPWPGKPWKSRRNLWWLLASGPIALFLYVLILIPFTPSISDLRKAKTDQPAQLVSSDGRLLAEYKWINREWVTLKDIAQPVKDALIATEDHRFYEHFGLDWKRTLSAVVRTIGGDKQGGSTITQQLARNLYPEEIGRAPTLNRKLKEAITALKIEMTYSKDEILETYLNTVPFLYNAFGIEMAARTYFDKSADELNVIESATLIGMLKGTVYYNPVLNPERAQDRRNTVLAQMKKREKLSAAEYDKLIKRPLRIRFERQAEVNGLAPHLAQQLRRQLIDWADREGYSLYSDGLVIRTTVNGKLQEMANQAVEKQGKALQAVANKVWAPQSVWGTKSALVQKLVRESSQYEQAVGKGGEPDEVLKNLLENSDFMGKLKQQKTRLQAGFLALDPRDGTVLAWVGSRDYAQDPFDHVQAARRQPGSTFKPFVYGAAFAKGLKPSDTFMDEPVEIPIDGGRQVWKPTDDSAPSYAPMTLSDGLAYSKNIITAQVMQQVGPEKVAQLARAMGVRESKLDEVPSLALGTSPVTLKEMVASYGSIANAGAYLAPTVITQIEDKDGKVLEKFGPAKPQRALALVPAQELRNAMRGVINKGTGVAIRSRYGISADVAGKTGTTQDNTDGWFIMMHPQIVAGAWVGFNDGRITLRSDYWGQGAHSALPIVGQVFQQAVRGKIVDNNLKFVDEEEHSIIADAIGSVRNWVVDLFGRSTEQIQPPAATTPEVQGSQLPQTPRTQAPVTYDSDESRPEIGEAPLKPLQNATPDADSEPPSQPPSGAGESQDPFWNSPPQQQQQQPPHSQPSQPAQMPSGAQPPMPVNGQIQTPQGRVVPPVQQPPQFQPVPTPYVPQPSNNSVPPMPGGGQTVQPPAPVPGTVVTSPVERGSASPMPSGLN
ncbi:penicillin-binding protein [Diaphorobacter sp. HDW4A]|uniref:penicillin-binding protein 1A n=1 Tax=Diaphorobacter sp. HDW4A TaxID=2714924 RepID=UPI001407D706|nr:transglycosylase domain-containing protein [Diaphorobacter sp. HDW4A]QIL80067.1 penicillin-binding protein [Diaphorobacter sp. HDW4A]